MLSAIEDRQQQIVNYLKVHQFATVADLIELVNYLFANLPLGNEGEKVHEERFLAHFQPD